MFYSTCIRDFLRSCRNIYNDSRICRIYDIFVSCLSNIFMTFIYNHNNLSAIFMSSFNNIFKIAATFFCIFRIFRTTKQSVFSFCAYKFLPVQKQNIIFIKLSLIKICNSNQLIFKILAKILSKFITALHGKIITKSNPNPGNISIPIRLFRHLIYKCRSHKRFSTARRTFKNDW